MTDALVEIAGELYSLLPAEFTAERNDRAKRLRASDRELADAVAVLRRPSAAAWLANQLARRRPDELAQLLELGERLRAAQSGLDAASLGELTRERRKQVQALAREAGELAVELGNPVRESVIEEVAETLRAAMTDASAAGAVASGRLTRGLEVVGTEVDLAGAVGGGDAGPPPKRPELHDEVGERRRTKAQAARERAERRIAEALDAAHAAELEAATSRERAERARVAFERATDARDALVTALRELEQRLDDAERTVADRAEASRAAERESEQARRAAVTARELADQLRAELGRH
ncbi:transposase [Agromyces soli]